MKRCIIIGASHAGVSCAFALRREGWAGEITLIDSDPVFPYHRPPLSKAYLSSLDNMGQKVLRSTESYEQENIHLQLGKSVKGIDRVKKTIQLEDGITQAYDKLVLATGARAFLPSIEGLDSAVNCFPMRTAQDAINIREAFQTIPQKKVLIIGGGYIGLETAASLQKLGGTITVLEREERILARVAPPTLSNFFHQLHRQKGVSIHPQKEVIKVVANEEQNEIICADGSTYQAHLIVVGVGIKVNQELAKAAGLAIENGIKVNAQSQTSDENIYAIGDCTYHYNPYYERYLRLESVQNANDQAKVAAAAICGKETTYDSLPWFWSDQYDIKWQTVGLSNGFTDSVLRKETDQEKSFSVWYFKEERLLAVDAINHGKAYMLGTKYLKQRQIVDKAKLADSSIPFKPKSFLKE
ncbi:MAG: FAD-dependent oxidoreductase [Bacteroidota bacterium]